MNFLWLGLFFVLVGFGLILFHLSDEGVSIEAEGGGVVMIGPLPILFGSNSRYAFIALVLGVLALIFLYLFLFLDGF